MEDVLEVYHRPYGDNEVLVCLDETSKQQTKETRRVCRVRHAPERQASTITNTSAMA